MNAKKAVKRLNRADVLVTRVLDQLGKRHAQAQELLKTAKESLNRAKGAIGVQSAETQRVPAKTGETQSPRPPKLAKKQGAAQAKRIRSTSKRSASKNTTRRSPAVPKTAAKKAARQPARVQPAARKRVAAPKKAPALSQTPGHKAKSAATAATSAAVPAKSPTEPQTGPLTQSPEPASRVIDSPLDLRRS